MDLLDDELDKLEDRRPGHDGEHVDDQIDQLISANGKLRAKMG